MKTFVVLLGTLFLASCAEDASDLRSETKPASREGLRLTGDLDPAVQVDIPVEALLTTNDEGTSCATDAEIDDGRTDQPIITSGNAATAMAPEPTSLALTDDLTPGTVSGKTGSCRWTKLTAWPSDLVCGRGQGASEAEAKTFAKLLAATYCLCTCVNANNVTLISNENGLKYIRLVDRETNVVNGGYDAVVPLARFFPPTELPLKATDQKSCQALVGKTNCSGFLPTAVETVKFDPANAQPYFIEKGVRRVLRLKTK